MRNRDLDGLDRDLSEVCKIRRKPAGGGNAESFEQPTAHKKQQQLSARARDGKIRWKSPNREDAEPV